jgi:S1-C subfamily serine protease
VHRSTLPISGAVGLVAAAVIGGAVALGGAALLGGVGGGTTTVRELAAATGSTEPTAFAQGKRLTIAEVYSRSAPGVVQVTSTSVTPTQSNSFFGNPFNQPQTQTSQALGSGFVVDKAGHIITNYHVVQGAKSVEVSFNDNESLKARIVGVDPSTDIAVLQVDAHSRALTPLPLGNSDQIQVGDEVVAIGNPFGLDRSITSGIVSALQRGITAPNNYEIDHVIQTDAALNHGNSGGPLLNAQGQVIGVNSQIQTDGGEGNIGIGFAIPIDTVKDVAAQLISKGVVTHAFLGVDARAITPDVARLFRLPVKSGLLVGTVCSATGAAKAGLRGAKQQVTVAGETWPLGGDIIVKADGIPVASVEQLRGVIAQQKPGDMLQLSIYRGAKVLSLQVKLGPQPLTPQC